MCFRKVIEGTGRLRPIELLKVHVSGCLTQYRRSPETNGKSPEVAREVLRVNHLSPVLGVAQAGEAIERHRDVAYWHLSDVPRQADDIR